MLATFSPSDQSEMFDKCVETFRLIRSAKGYQNMFQKRDLLCQKDGESINLGLKSYHICISSFVAKSPSRGKKSMENVSREYKVACKLSENITDGFNSCFDTRFRIYAIPSFGIRSQISKGCIGRRAEIIWLQTKNFGLNIIYFVLGLSVVCSLFLRRLQQ